MRAQVLPSSPTRPKPAEPIPTQPNPPQPNPAQLNLTQPDPTRPDPSQHKPACIRLNSVQPNRIDSAISRQTTTRGHVTFPTRAKLSLPHLLVGQQTRTCVWKISNRKHNRKTVLKSRPEHGPNLGRDMGPTTVVGPEFLSKKWTGFRPQLRGRHLDVFG